MDDHLLVAYDRTGNGKLGSKAEERLDAGVDALVGLETSGSRLELVSKVPYTFVAITVIPLVERSPGGMTASIAETGGGLRSDDDLENDPGASLGEVEEPSDSATGWGGSFCVSNTGQGSNMGSSQLCERAKDGKRSHQAIQCLDSPLNG